jgi:hypothetical protein
MSKASLSDLELMDGTYNYNCPRGWCKLDGEVQGTHIKIHTFPLKIEAMNNDRERFANVEFVLVT